jgi:hypothetical protein
MADANSIAESQQKPGDHPQHHPPREPVLQVIGDLFQPFALSRRAGLDASQWFALPEDATWMNPRSFAISSRKGSASSLVTNDPLEVSPFVRQDNVTVPIGMKPS